MELKKLTRKGLALIACLPLFSSSFAQLTEGFDDINNLAAAGWIRTNKSSPLGLTGWSQGATAVFSSFEGVANSYISANYNNTTGGTGTISNWLISPEITFNNGDVITFYSRSVTGTIYADRLEFRMSTNGASSDVGATANSVGDFTTLLTTINPSLVPTGYPDEWTQYRVTVSGLSGPTNGRLAFRYFVTSAGPTGANSNYIGIDNFSYRTCPEPVITPSGPTALCEGNSVTLNTDNYLSTPLYSIMTFSLDGVGWAMDEVSWTITNNSGIIVAGGTGYPEAPALYENQFVANDGPYTFSIETQGVFNDNDVDYELKCNGTVLLSGTLAGGLTFSQSNLGCDNSLPANVTYAWTPGTGLSATNIQSPVATPAADQVYSLTATDAGSGCSGSQSVSITVNPLPAAPSITASGPTTFCEGDSVILSSSEASGNLWSGGETSQSITVYDAGSYTVSYEDGNGCQSPPSTTTVVNVTLAPAPALDSNSPVCEGDDILLEGSASGGTYFWSGPDGFTSSNENPTIPASTPANAGNYSAYVVENGCTSATSTIAVVVDPNPTASFTVNNTGVNYTFTNTSQNATSVSWNFGDGSPASNENSPTHTYTQNGVYTVTLTATNACGSSTSTQTVTITGLSIDEFGLLYDVTVYPNPSENHVNISVSLEEAVDITFKVYDLQGKLLINEFVGKAQGKYTHQIDISTLAAGSYQLSLETADAKVVRQIIKR